MRHFSWFVACWAGLAVGCNQSGTQTADSAAGGDEQQASAADAPPEGAVGDLVIGEPIRHANLTIFPVTSRTPKTEDRFITLDAGLKSGEVEVMEVGSPAAVAANGAAPSATTQQSVRQTAHVETANSIQSAANPFAHGGGGADVNTLLVVNRSVKPLYLMPGEIVVGGQQDRVVGEEYVIAPTTKPTPINVYCVEHGRWNHRGEAEVEQLVTAANANAGSAMSVSIAGNIADPKAIAGEAAKGKFIGSVGNVSHLARITVQGEKNQSAVWDKVGVTNGLSMNASSSNAFTENYAGAKVVRELEPYIAALTKPVQEQPQIVGVLVSINGRMETLDVFESTPLFQQLWPKLLKSYSLDAANAPEESADKSNTLADAKDFLTKTTTTAVADTASAGDVETTTRKSGDFICFTARDKRRDAESGAMGDMGGGGGFGALHLGGGFY